jgi:hypothetical protein
MKLDEVLNAWKKVEAGRLPASRSDVVAAGVGSELLLQFMVTVTRRPRTGSGMSQVGCKDTAGDCGACRLSFLLREGKSLEKCISIQSTCAACNKVNV